MQKLAFLNQCLVPKTKFIHSSREKAWTKYHAACMENLPLVADLTGSTKSAAWLCLSGFKELVELNYPLTSSSTERRHSSSTELSEQNRDVIHYIGGSILCKIKKRTAVLQDSQMKECLTECLSVMTCRENPEGENQEQSMTGLLNRGALIFLTPETKKLFELLELKFREFCETKGQKYTATDFETSCAQDSQIISHFTNTLHNVQETDITENVKNRLFGLCCMHLYNVRVHHECQQFMEKQKSCTKTKGLRKTLKPSN